MDMKESFKYRYGADWDEVQNPNLKFIWVMVWEHAKHYYEKLHLEQHLEQQQQR